MEDTSLNWPQTSLSSSNPPASLNNDEDLLDFELESETCNMRSPPSHRYAMDSHRLRHSSNSSRDSVVAEKDYSFFANDEVVSGSGVDVAFFPDVSRSAGESSSAEEDVVTVPPADDSSPRGGSKSKKNRKKKK